MKSRDIARSYGIDNEAFDGWLKAMDPRYGVRVLGDVDAVASEHGFARMHLARLPANNLLLGFRRG